MRALGCALSIAAALIVTRAAAAEFALAPDDRVVGNLQEYVAQNGDNLADIARHFDIGYTEILAANPGVDPWSPGAGRKLTIPSLYIVPDVPRRGIVLNLAERRLYYFLPDGRVRTYPIGIGAIGFNTPLSTTTVVRKEPSPTWAPPPSIRAEQPDLPAAIGPGPDNPLGDYALRLGWKNYLLHGTNKPDGVGRNVSHGCIHLYPEDIAELFNTAQIGTSVRVIEQPAGAAWIGIGLYVEAHPGKEQADQLDTEQPMAPQPLDGLRDQVNAVARQNSAAVDWSAVDRAGLERSGLPVEVAMRPPDAVEQPSPVAVSQTGAPETIAQAPASEAVENLPVDDDEGPRRPMRRHRHTR